MISVMGGIIEKTEFERCGAIDYHYDFFKIAACLVKHIGFIPVELKIMIVARTRARYNLIRGSEIRIFTSRITHCARKVETFAADS